MCGSGLDCVSRAVSLLGVSGVLVVRTRVSGITQQTASVAAVNVGALLKLITNTDWYRECWRQEAR
jgi:hypothetical protein